MALRFIAGAIIAAATLLAVQAMAEEDAQILNFDIDNSTPWVITSAFVRPSGGNFGWSTNLIENSSLSPDWTQHVHFGGVPHGCFHDVWIGWSDNRRAEWDNVNLCRVHDFRVWYDFGVKKNFQASWN